MGAETGGEMIDLVKRARWWADGHHAAGSTETAALLRGLADEIERLRGERDRAAWDRDRAIEILELHRRLSPPASPPAAPAPPAADERGGRPATPIEARLEEMSGRAYPYDATMLMREAAGAIAEMRAVLVAMRDVAAGQRDLCQAHGLPTAGIDEYLRAIDAALGRAGRAGP